MTHADIIMKLIGRISPIGMTEADNDRFENLKTLCDLLTELLVSVKGVSTYKDAPEFSLKRAGTFADNFLKTITEEFKN